MKGSRAWWARIATLASVASMVVVVACSAGPTPPSPGSSATPGSSGTPAPSIGPLPTPADHDLSAAELKYRLIDAFAPLTYCDPDEYPVAHGDESEKAVAQFPAIQTDVPTFSAILDRLGLIGQETFGAEQKLAIYREWKRLNAVVLSNVADDRLAFDLVTETDPGMGRGTQTKGTIDSRGAIVVESSQPAVLAGCPICLARGTLIDTPRGPVAVEALAAGDPVWSVDANGRRVAATIARVGRAAVPADHHVIRLALDDGRSVTLSPGHPLADGGRAGDVRAGDFVDGARVVSAELVTYGSPFTYDLLPSSDSGLYWANGILLASTLRR